MSAVEAASPGRFEQLCADCDLVADEQAGPAIQAVRRGGSARGERLAERLQERAVDRLVAGDDRPVSNMSWPPSRSVTKPPASRIIRMPAATSQGDRPLLPETVEAAGRDIGEVERGRAQAADAGDLGHDVAQLDEVVAVMAAAEMRHAGADHRVGELGAARRRAGGGRS